MQQHPHIHTSHLTCVRENTGMPGAVSYATRQTETLQISNGWWRCRHGSVVYSTGQPRRCWARAADIWQRSLINPCTGMKYLFLPCGMLLLLSLLTCRLQRCCCVWRVHGPFTCSRLLRPTHEHSGLSHRIRSAYQCACGLNATVVQSFKVHWDPTDLCVAHIAEVDKLRLLDNDAGISCNCSPCFWNL